MFHEIQIRCYLEYFKRKGKKEGEGGDRGGLLNRKTTTY